MLNKVLALMGPSARQAVAINETVGGLNGTSESGSRASPDNEARRIYQMMEVDYSHLATVQDMRQMDKADGRVKKIHSRMAATAVRSQLQLAGDPSPDITKRFEAYIHRLGLDQLKKRKSDARGLLVEGTLAMQWVLNADNQVAAGVRMPSETIVPQVEANGRFKDPRHAFSQIDIRSGRARARFALWQMTLGRLDPDNEDDFGCMGRPLLDATRATFKMLQMTDRDLAVRRRDRAPLRFSHVLEGATPDEVAAYKKQQEQSANTFTRDFYQNKKGGVSAIQGDANLGEINDIMYLLDTFYAGGPGGKGIYGYADKLSRDVLEDLKKEYYEEVDTIQEVLAGVYQFGFVLDLWLAGQMPGIGWRVEFVERQTETRNQRADLALKYGAMGASFETQMRASGLDAELELKRKERESKDQRLRADPYGGDDAPGGGRAPVKITPGNARKGESATTVSTRSAAR